MNTALLHTLRFTACAAAVTGGWLLGSRQDSASDPAAGRSAGRTGGIRASAAAAGGAEPARPARTVAEIAAIVRPAPSDDPVADRLRMVDMVESMSAAEIAASLPELMGDRTFRILAMHRWASLEPEAAWQWFRSVPPELLENLDDPRYETSAALFRAWAARDPEAAFAAATRANLRKESGNALWSVASAVMQKDPARAFAMLDGRSLDAGYERITGSQIRPENAAAFMKSWASIPEGQKFDYRFERLVNGAFSTWSSTDPKAALEWASTQPDNRRVRFLPEVLGDLAATDLPAAMEAFTLLPNSPERERAGPSLAARMAEKDPAGALKWARENLAAGRSEALGEIASALAARDPQSALQSLESLPPGPGRDSFIASTVRTWAEKDLTAAAAWAQSFAPGAERAAAISAVADQWIRKDPSSFAEYAASAPSAEVPEHLLGATAGALVRNDPAEAVKWVSSLSETRGGRATTGLIGTLTSEKDAKGLVSFLDALPVGRNQDAALQQAASNFRLDEGGATFWLANVAENAALRSRLTAMLPELPLSDAERTAWKKTLTSK